MLPMAFLILAVASFLAALAAAIAAGFARGRDARAVETIDDSGPMWSDAPHSRRGLKVHAAGHSRRKGRGVALSFITMEHLRSGKATPAEWTQVIATMVALISFATIFLNIAWLIGRSKPFVAIVMVVIPGLWIAGILRDVLTDWHGAKPAEPGGGE